MQKGYWTELFNYFDEDIWSWWFSLQTIQEFEEFCDGVNDGDWDLFFEELDEDATISFLNAWTDEMWIVAEDSLDDDILEYIY